MENQRKVVLYIAQSLDGYIARENDEISWLSIVERDNEDYGYNEFVETVETVETVDTVFMGRKTYEKVLTFDVEFPHKGRNCYVLSKTLKGSDENVHFFSGDVDELIKKIKTEEGKDIFIDGGSEVVRAFRDKDLIDEYVISIIPILLGKGIRLFRDTDTENNLKLIESKAFESGLVQLRYERVKLEDKK
ncbi:dihydrofolate reductase [Acetoanaerobium pronyense]|uniref:Dihydrofolate reductase n=1 Tax=Acetoanaerobium pronyense TaxID=1482736 RepID=A0ABS4KIW5_9FIRM|nr:dihydrofolate reductase [Acetoanaerobium pronyense]